MGRYINADSPFDAFKTISKEKYYVDKSLIINKFNELVDTTNKYVCITRPRRFGKSELANMIASYYGKGYDSKQYFEKLKISEKEDYYMNKYNVVFIDFSKGIDDYETIKKYIMKLTKNIFIELNDIYPQADVFEEEFLYDGFDRIYDKTNEKFIFIIDEWDYIFSNNLFKESEREYYLRFLKNLLKGRGYVAFTYMTGVLPIAKYSSGSALNMFRESTMFKNNIYSEFLGFTEDEVRNLCKINTTLRYEDLENWYNGYKTEGGLKLFNPRSVIYALRDNLPDSYWTRTGPMDEIMYYISNNIEEVREDVVRMVAGESIDIELDGYSAEVNKPETRDQILSAMVVYGFLSYCDGKLSIPNKELMLKFKSTLKDKRLGYVSILAKQSDIMLKATLEKDTSTMASILEYTHDMEIPFYVYNDENSLSCIITLIYLNARSKYDIVREDKAGKGFVDYIFYPNNKSDKVIIMELKKGKSAKEAIEQIHKKKYFLGLKERGYIGDVLLVGINYDEDKKHECIVETL